ncbi:MAG: RraA family protein [Silicimonas sp.]|nr:RraA family protein [Silicimonas sp.]
MLEEPKPLRVRRPTKRPTAEQIALFQKAPSSVVADAMINDGVFQQGIRALAGEAHVAGPALTVGCEPGDILALKAAISFIEPGDVVVSTSKGFTHSATMGDLVAGRIKNAGAEGFVTDGAVRDATGIIETGLAVWCQGRTPASPFSNGPGTIGLPISIGGQTVESGDMVVADGDGVVVVPFALIDDIAAKVTHILSAEVASEEVVKKGATTYAASEALLNSDQTDWID